MIEATKLELTTDGGSGQRLTRARVTHHVWREVIVDVPAGMVAPEHRHLAVRSYSVPIGHNLPVGQGGEATFYRMPTGEQEQVEVVRDGCAFGSWLMLSNETGNKELRVWVVFDDEGGGKSDAPGRLVRVIVQDLY